MEQTGINSVQLIENKDLSIRYNSDGSVESIRNDGDFIEIDSCYQTGLTVKQGRNKNGISGYNYELNFIELEAENINKIRRSIYGFYAILNFVDGAQKVILTPLLFSAANQDNNSSASYSTKIINFVKTGDKIVNFDGGFLPWILDTGYWNDDAYWVDSAIWID